MPRFEAQQQFPISARAFTISSVVSYSNLLRIVRVNLFNVNTTITDTYMYTYEILLKRNIIRGIMSRKYKVSF